MPRIREATFIWIPRNQTTNYKIYIDGTDQRQKVVSSEWMRAVTDEVGSFKIVLDNNNSEFTGTFQGNETVELQLDFSTGTTTLFKGYIEKIKNNAGGKGGYTLEIEGTHFSGELLNITVTGIYESTATSTILSTLISTYLTGYTGVNVETGTLVTRVEWENKPFWGAVQDLCNLSNFDCYVDDSKDFHFFLKNTKETLTEAIIFDDTFISVEGFGTDLVEVRNIVKTVGEDDSGLPVLWQTQDTSSQATAGNRELVIKDTNLSTGTQAEEAADAQLLLNSSIVDQGKALSWILPTLVPGVKLWIVNPPQNIHSQYRVLKYIHKLPMEQTEVVISKDTTIPKLFRDRINKEIATTTINNPYGMKYSFNFPFNDTTNVNTTASTNITISSGVLKATSTATIATMISDKKTFPATITSVYVLIIGENYSNTVFSVSTDSGSTYQTITPSTLTSLTTSADNIIFKVLIDDTLKSTSPAILDSIAVLVK